MAALVASRALSATRHVDEHLRIAAHDLPQARESGLPVSLHDRGELQRGDEAVAGRVVLEEDDVARLLAAEHRARRLQLLEHVAVADLGLDDVDAALAHRDLEAEVGT